MPAPNPSAMEFMLSRRSRPAKTLNQPAPDAQALKPILTAAARTPDHGKLEPWRFIVLQGDALKRIAGVAEHRGKALGLDEAKIDKGRAQFADSPLCVAVVQIERSSEKIPLIEQTYSAGAVCLAMLNAALASGWGANWLSGWVAHDRGFLQEALGLSSQESIAGFIHIGTETTAPPERPRPTLEDMTTWVSK